MTRVAFFGGSFDPPHFGHVLAVAYARGRGFDRVLVVPVQSHAFGKRLALFEHRVAMARLAFANVTGVEVSDLEAALPEPNFTLNTLLALQERHPAWQMRLLIGSDVILEVSNWNRFEEVERLAPPFVVPRTGVDASAEALEFGLPRVSSTRVRTVLASRHADAGARPWLEARVPAEVLEYIDRIGLYC